MAVGGGAGPARAGQPRYAKALLILRHPRGLQHFVRGVSDPGSPRYREYAGVGRLVHRFGASHRTREAAMSWLAERGLRGELGPTGTYVLAQLPTARAARLLGARSAKSFAHGAETARGRVPPALHKTVTGVSLLSTRPGAVRPAIESATGSPTIPPLPAEHGSLRDRTGTPAGCSAGRQAGFAAPDSSFTPNQYLTAYGHSALHSRGLRGGGERVALVEIDGFKRGDVTAFDRCFGVRPPPIHVHTVNSPVLAPGGETTLDLEVLTAAAPRLDRIDVYEGSSSAAGLFESEAAALGRKGNRPDVISMSIEGCEPRFEGSRGWWRAMNHVFAVAAGAGISTVVAAGDQGSSMCTEDTPQNQTALGLVAASVPADSPYVTAVGGTNLVLDASNRIKNQLVWKDEPVFFAAGGGAYSILAGQPWWQKGVRGAKSDAARALPDVAGLADIVPGYAIYCTASSCKTQVQQIPGWVGVGGTSAATPLLAAGTALIDQNARRHGQAPVGFLNPLLYRLGRSSARHRVFWGAQHGNNDLGRMIPPEAGGGHALGCCSARPGYDRVNGWGSPGIPALDRAARRAASG
jgi:subtilase family serine protease